MKYDSYEKINEVVRTQLSFEFNCDPEDFKKSGNSVTSSVVHEKRRKFSEKAFFIRMATFGAGTVISADERLHPWLNEWIKGKDGIWLFEQHNFYELECEVRKHGYKMALTHHMFLPKPELMNIETDLKIKWFEKDEFSQFYGKEEWSNVLCDHFRPDRPDMLVAAALDGERIMGMAGASADTPEMWQIGIDVLPEYRGRGIAKTLVTLLRDEIFKRGAIPYYGTGLSNLGSWKTALGSGFVPAWVEVESREIKDDAFAK